MALCSSFVGLVAFGNCTTPVVAVKVICTYLIGVQSTAALHH